VHSLGGYAGRGSLRCPLGTERDALVCGGVPRAGHHTPHQRQASARPRPVPHVDTPIPRGATPGARPSRECVYIECNIKLVFDHEPRARGAAATRRLCANASGGTPTRRIRACEDSTLACATAPGSIAIAAHLLAQLRTVVHSVAVAPGQAMARGSPVRPQSRAPALRWQARAAERRACRPESGCARSQTVARAGCPRPTGTRTTRWRPERV
jgi:hypothetical protein